MNIHYSVSSLAYTTKRDGSLRNCLDPQKLNKAMRRFPHIIPTLEELNPMFTNAKVFTKLDAKAGYWAVKLDESSQLLITTSHHIPHTVWKVLLAKISIWAQQLPRHLPAQNGLHPRGSMKQHVLRSYVN